MKHTLEGDLITATAEEDVPVVVSIAACRPLCGSVDVAVGDGNVRVRVETEDVVLASNEGGLHQSHG